jgi:C1A family cysteine protease
MARKISRYGWVPDLPDYRDYLFAAAPQFLTKLPASVDLRKHCPPVYDQGQLGSCTANAIGAAVQFERMKQKLKPNFLPSRLFIYYNERAMEGTVNSDSGAQIRDGIKVVATLGDCPETEWPYVINEFTVKPPKRCYQDALKYRSVSYQRVMQNLSQMKGCLASGYPFVFGFTVYESFESPAVARTGILPMPKSGEKTVGGHAVMAVGYDDKKGAILVRNSWGKNWGQQGYFEMPYTYISNQNLADDLWTIRLMLAVPRRRKHAKTKRK